MPVNEFTLIQRYFSNLVFSHPAVTLGVGDDAAIIQLPPEQELCFSLDTQIAGTHFPSEAPPAQIAQRAFRAAISDLSAMGAEPLCFTLALTLPEADESWLQGFSEGLCAAAGEARCSLLGGDTTQGPLSITLQVQGLCPSNSALRRSGAQAGDAVLVSGYLGNAAAYVHLLQNNLLDKPEWAHARELFEAAYYQPILRTDLGMALRGRASAAIDLSDGLLADLGHICEASGLGAKVYAEQVPCYPELSELFGIESMRRLALSGGDDYELCFAVPQDRLREVIKMGEDMECPLTVIGEMVTREPNSPFIALLDAAGKALPLPAQSGYQHFV